MTFLSLVGLVAATAESTASIQFNRTLEVVINSMDIIETVTGRNIILFLGESQVGKSTTINALRGIQFEWQKSENNISIPALVPLSPVSKLPLAAMGNGVQRTTMKPEVYEGIPDFLIVDNRGVGELGKDRSGDIAASILMEMVCKAAQSVRIVVVVSFSQLCRIQSLRSLMKQVGNLIPDPSSNIYWLVNRHYFNRPGSVPVTEQMETTIMQEIRGEIERIWKAVEDVEIPSEESESTSLGKAEMRTIIAIREALNAEPPRIGYLDPTSEWSIQHMRKEITGILAIPNSEIKFDTVNRYRPLFDNEMRKLLDRETRLLVTYKVLSEIEGDSIFDITKTNETIKDLDREKERINEIGLELQRLQDEINSTQQKEEILYTDKFNVPVQFFHWWPVYQATYLSQLRLIPISSWKDTVERGTKRINVTYEGDSEFPVISFQAEFFVPCRGKVEFYAKSLDIPARKAEFRRNLRWCDILVQERDNLIGTTKTQQQEVDERRLDLFTIARAHKQVSSMMNNTRGELMNKYKKLVIRLWNPSAGRPTRISQVDEFLFALEEYHRSLEDNLKPGSLTIGNISKLVSYARAWLETDVL
jgi:energy-coupling factor transporter ATP-binding protein EcfA2